MSERGPRYSLVVVLLMFFMAWVRSRRTAPDAGWLTLGGKRSPAGGSRA